MFIPLVAWNNLLKRLNPAEELLYYIALLVKFQIESEWLPSFRISPRSRVDWGIALNFSFPVVLTNLPDIIGCICGDSQGAILNIGSLKCFEGWFIEPGIVGNGRENSAKTIPLLSDLLNQTADVIQTLVDYSMKIREDSKAFSQDSLTSSVYLSEGIQNADNGYSELKWQYALPKFVIPILMLLMLIGIITLLFWFLS